MTEQREHVQAAGWMVKCETFEDQDDASYTYDGKLTVRHSNSVPYENYWARINYDRDKIPRDAQLERIYLILTAEAGSKGYILAGNRVYRLAGNSVKIDVTHIMLDRNKTYVDITPVTYTDCPVSDIAFYASGAKGPRLEYRYSYDGASPRPVRK